MTVSHLHFMGIGGAGDVDRVGSLWLEVAP